MSLLSVGSEEFLEQELANISELQYILFVENVKFASLDAKNRTILDIWKTLENHSAIDIKYSDLANRIHNDMLENLADNPTLIYKRIKENTAALCKDITNLVISKSFSVFKNTVKSAYTLYTAYAKPIDIYINKRKEKVNAKRIQKEQQAIVTEYNYRRIIREIENVNTRSSIESIYSSDYKIEQNKKNEFY